MMRLAALVIAVLALSGCAGAQFKLPPITDSEISRASLAVAGDTSALTAFYRTQQEDGQTLIRVFNRLRPAVQPLCKRAATENCVFYIAYNPGDEVNAFADAGISEMFQPSTSQN